MEDARVRAGQRVETNRLDNARCVPLPCPRPALPLTPAGGQFIRPGPVFLTPESRTATLYMASRRTARTREEEPQADQFHSVLKEKATR